ncbi:MULTISPECIES: helix-turn-helix domain-containing protein [Cysteiniphilum]
MYNQGIGATKIASELGICRDSVYKILRKSVS